MSFNPKTPMALYKANLELVLRIGTLLQENRQRWMQAGAAGSTEAIQRTLAETQRMLTTNDWSTLSKIPGEEFWNSMGTGAAPLKGTVETAVRSQTEFAEGLKQAFAEWQQQSADALGGVPAQPTAWAFSDLMKGFGAAAAQQQTEFRASAPAPSKSAPPKPASKAKSPVKTKSPAKTKSAEKAKKPAKAKSAVKAKTPAKAKPKAVAKKASSSARKKPSRR